MGHWIFTGEKWSQIYSVQKACQTKTQEHVLRAAVNQHIAQAVSGGLYTSPPLLGTERAL